MPRRPRKLLHEGRLFHITARGVAGSMIFTDDFDRRRFVMYLEDVSESWGWRVISWCLMGTHYHLVVEATQEQMSLAVHRLRCLYAMYFNRRHERRGHLFENRFSATLIRDDDHFGRTVAYVENNPVGAGLCVEATDWVWTWPRPAPEVRPAA
jgi:REP-associated tyrosine transposase